MTREQSLIRQQQFRDRMDKFREERKKICKPCLLNNEEFFNSCSGCTETDALYNEIFKGWPHDFED